MRALLAPQTAMRHHSQRGPEAAQGGRADSEERRERNARGLNFFYLEDGGLESALPPPALLIRRQTVTMGNAPNKWMNSFLFCSSTPARQFHKLHGS